MNDFLFQIHMKDLTFKICWLVFLLCVSALLFTGGFVTLICSGTNLVLNEFSFWTETTKQSKIVFWRHFVHRIWLRSNQALENPLSPLPCYWAAGSCCRTWIWSNSLFYRKISLKMCVHVDSSPSPTASWSLLKPYSIKGQKELNFFSFIRGELCILRLLQLISFLLFFSWHLLETHVFWDFIYFFRYTIYTLVTCSRQHFVSLDSDSRGLDGPASSPTVSGFFFN